MGSIPRRKPKPAPDNGRGKELGVMQNAAD